MDSWNVKQTIKSAIIKLITKEIHLKKARWRFIKRLLPYTTFIKMPRCQRWLTISMLPYYNKFNAQLNSLRGNNVSKKYAFISSFHLWSLSVCVLQRIYLNFWKACFIHSSFKWRNDRVLLFMNGFLHLLFLLANA